MATAAAAVKKNTGSGYLGDLSPEQEKVFVAFQASARLAGTKPDVTNDDYALLRFLRARKFDLKAAEEMRNKHLEWRKKWDVEHLAKNRPPKMDLVDKLVAGSHHFLDKEGRPVIYEKLAKAKNTQTPGLFTRDEYLRCHIYKMLTLVGRCEEATRTTGKHVETFTMVLDLSGVTLMAGNQEFLTMCSENDNLNFPERLGRMILINVPWVFPVFWKLASPFIDAKTKAKIAVVYGVGTADLLKEINEDVLPAEYGGKCNCKGKGKPCVPEFDISDLKLSDITGHASVETVTVIPAGKKHEHVLTSKPKGATLHWYFRVDADYDVNFSVTCESADKKTKTVVKEPAKMKSHQGEHKMDSGATWTVCWDNSYSWYSEKKVQWSAMIVNHEDLPPVPATAATGTAVAPGPNPSAPPAAAADAGAAASVKKYEPAEQQPLLTAAPAKPTGAEPARRAPALKHVEQEVKNYEQRVSSVDEQPKPKPSISVNSGVSSKVAKWESGQTSSLAESRAAEAVAGQDASTLAPIVPSATAAPAATAAAAVVPPATSAVDAALAAGVAGAVTTPAVTAAAPTDSPAPTQ